MSEPEQRTETVTYWHCGGEGCNTKHNSFYSAKRCARRGRRRSREAAQQRYREAWRLRQSGMKWREIAAQLGVSENHACQLGRKGRDLSEPKSESEETVPVL